MRWLFGALIAVHGLLHFMGAARAFGVAEIPGLTQPISKGQGVAWLLAAIALLATAVLLVRAPRWWWVVGLAAALLSQAVILSSWSDAKFGTVANALLLAGVVYGFASEGPFGLRAEYRRGVTEHAGATGPPPPLTEADLAPLPEPVQRYLRVTGTVGRPRVRDFRARWRGRIRAGPQEPWMEFTAEQHNFLDGPARFFLMKARRGGLPLDVLHVFRDGSASMRVRLLSLVSVVDARGPEMTRAETVTLLNDLCILAPAGLIDPAIEWEAIDRYSARARYTVGPNTIGAVLSFNETGELEDFVSDDRLAAAPDGARFTRQRWSTPVADYRSFGPRRIATRGEGRWDPPDGEEFVYLDGRVIDLQVNVSGGAPPRS